MATLGATDTLAEQVARLQDGQGFRVGIECGDPGLGEQEANSGNTQLERVLAAVEAAGSFDGNNEALDLPISPPQLDHIKKKKRKSTVDILVETCKRAKHSKEHSHAERRRSEATFESLVLPKTSEADAIETDAEEKTAMDTSSSEDESEAIWSDNDGSGEFHPSDMGEEDLNEGQLMTEEEVEWLVIRNMRALMHLCLMDPIVMRVMRHTEGLQEVHLAITEIAKRWMDEWEDVEPPIGTRDVAEFLQYRADYMPGHYRNVGAGDVYEAVRYL